MHFRLFLTLSSTVKKFDLNAFLKLVCNFLKSIRVEVMLLQNLACKIFLQTNFLCIALQLIFEGVRGETYRGDLAIDDIVVTHGVCPSSE